METSLHIINEILESLEMTTSTNKRKAILLANRDDECLREVVSYFLGDIPKGFTRNNIEKPIYHIVEPRRIDSISELMSYIKTRPECTEDDILIIQYFIKRKPRDERELWKKIICREYKFGLNEKTVAEIMGGRCIESTYNKRRTRKAHDSRAGEDPTENQDDFN